MKISEVIHSDVPDSLVIVFSICLGHLLLEIEGRKFHVKKTAR